MNPAPSNCKSEKHDCCGHSSGFEQTIDEIKFENSIFAACVYNDFEKVKKFIVKFQRENLTEEINRLDSAGYTALHYAARSGSYEICKLLLDSKAKVNIKTRNCLSMPLHRASYMCHTKIVELLLKNGANPLEQDCDGKTALHKCIENKNFKFEVAKILLNHSPKLLNIKDKHEKTPLEYCQDLKQLI